MKIPTDRQAATLRAPLDGVRETARAWGVTPARVHQVRDAVVACGWATRADAGRLVVTPLGARALKMHAAAAREATR